MSDARHGILAAIRTALARPSETGAATPPAADPDGAIRLGLARITPQSPAALLDRFREELERLGAEISVTSSLSAAAEETARALAEARVRRVAIGTTPAGEALMEALQSAGIGADRLGALSAETGRTLLADAEAAVTGADYGLALTGTLVFTPATLPERLAAGLPRWHIVILERARLVAHLAELFERYPDARARAHLFVTGPSRTADIEKTLVLGAHGPARLLVVVTGSEGSARASTSLT